MLKPNSLIKMRAQLWSLLIVMMFGFLVSCMPQQSAPAIQDSSNTTNNNPSANPTAYSEPTFTQSGTFIQEGGLQSSTQFSLPLDFTDSFLVRGKSLSQFLRTIPNTTRFCLVGKYDFTSGTDRFLILSAKPKSYTDVVQKTTEFYLQVEPSNDAANQNDCLTYNLTTTLYDTVVLPTVPSASFSLSQLCATCNSAVTSQGLRLYFNNGEAVPTLNLSLISLTIAGATTSSGNVCVDSSACKARNFDCCLEGQCVNDGAVRPGAITNPEFSQAQLDVASNPNRFIVYPQFYFVCASRPEEDGEEDGADPIDPAYDANIRLMELNHFYNCLNKVDGEFSHCTIKFLSASVKIAANSPFATEKGDVNFKTLNPNFANGDYANNIVKIFYGGQYLYEAHKTPLAPADGTFTALTSNDDITTAQSVKITKALPSNAQDDNLYLTFKIDGTCVKLGTNLAKCTKNYIQSSTETTSTSYHDSSKTFNLPTYADTSPAANILVKVAGIIVPEDASTWSKATSPNRIIFAPGYSIFQNQSIDITYYVVSGITDLLKIKTDVQTQVNSMCLCAVGGNCNLNPIYNSQNVITNYECVHPGAVSTDPPANQTVYVSNKNIAHRFYDTNGVNFDSGYATALDQEGTPFSYKNNDLLKPMNLDAYNGYTGFNEIYGSFSKTSTTAAKPSKLVQVKKDKIYDLFANSGVFSTCLTCGSDYYSSIKKIFPQSFSSVGGGYVPDNFASQRVITSGIYRSDDLLFGRACFVPATMIPWTHSSGSTVKDQRRNRLAGQHFLYANGYNRDWYGFDYGSLIASFDGVTWFSVGNQRRIKATSNKLFLAVNAYYGDLNLDSNFNVTVSETTIYSGVMPDHDTETDGAECQRSHFCSNDNDCFRQLGYDYSCQNITGLRTNWPQSDGNGNEVIGSVNKTLVSILGGSNGQSKRCIYRGRGAPCHPNLNSVASTFSTSTLTGTLACSSNNMCQPFSSGSSTRFNDRIARFANTPVAQNSAVAAPTPSDTVALGARILGRPFDFYGTKLMPSASATAMTGNNLTALCIPGKNVSGSTLTFDLNSSSPANRIDSSDKILGIGTTMSGSLNTKYLNACPATDTLGNSLLYTSTSLGVMGSNLNKFTTTQNLSTNLLDLVPVVAQNVFSSTAGSQIIAVGYQRNACLRAPGASCFSDMDCAPSEFIANKVRSADVTGILNAAEEKYWEEDLICGNPDYKYVGTGQLNMVTFDVKKNVCCRDYGKTFTVSTQIDSSSDHHWCHATSPTTINVAGINTGINSFNRYSRVHTAYDKMTCDIASVNATTSYALSLKTTVATDHVARYRQQASQFKTLDTVNSRTCCTKNWIRNFATTNGGGHVWAQGKLQTIDKKNFISLNWAPNNDADGTNNTPYDCNATNFAFMNPSCEIKNFTAAETDLYLKFFGGLELVGIPQVALISEDQVYKITDGTTGVAPGTATPVDETLVPYTVGAEDFVNTASPAKKFYSGSNYTALNSVLKKVFSEDEFSCCMPSGQEVPDYTTAEQCCTGYLANSGANTVLRCCLPDFTDLTVYLSRYVSSEGRGLPDSSYDTNTGYIKDPGVVELLATQKGLCCSGKFARGVAIRKLPIPIAGNTYINDPTAWTKRFVYLSNAVDNNGDFGPIGGIFDAGVRWNTHVYCIPESLEMPAEK
jgi:hypothetical protein